MNAPDHGDALAASRTTLELMATLMESSFEVLGEGVILASMPRYLERFGKDNAKWMRDQYGVDPPTGAASSLAVMNLISELTGTQFEMHEATKGRAVKRLKECEFVDAFAFRGEFPKTMMCMLHRAAYQGSVNGLVDEENGFDVQVHSRILFGDPHCDFEVVARGPSDATKDLPKLPMARPDAEVQDWLGYAFYTALLTAFIDFLTQQLPAKQVETMLRQCGRAVGAKVQALLHQAGLDGGGIDDAIPTVLRLGGRTFDGADVASCPQAEHIIAAAKGGAGAATRTNACSLCHHFVAGAVAAGHPGKNVTRDGAIALGDPVCGFRVEDA